MLPRICIFFLIFIQCLCYNYSFEEQQPRLRRFEENKSKRLHRHRVKPKEISHYEKGRYLGYSAYDDKESVAQINVAKFIQNPKTSQERPQPFRNFDQASYHNSIQDNMPEYNPVNQKINKKEEKQKINKHATKKKTKETNLEASGSNGSTKKKSILTKLKKIPFFFRNSVTAKVKGKDKKRKIARKLASTKQSPSPGVYTTEVMTSILKVQKRSCKEQLCPRCHKLFVPEADTNVRDKRFPNIIHNCRQYYLKQQTKPKQVTNPANNANSKISNALEEETEKQFKGKSNRKIRAEVSYDTLALQLQELENIEKMVTSN